MQNGIQKLILKDIKIKTNIGILDHEILKPQPISIDAELNLGTQPLKPNRDDISHVLDYRTVYELIIKESTKDHNNLLETLTGKLCSSLMHLPGVIGVRIKITKLAAFKNCRVSIQKQTGEWRENE